MSPDLLTKVILPLSLFLIMFGMGLSLKLADFKNVAKSPKALSIGLIGQMVLLPIAAFLIAIALALPPEIAVGLIIIALAPGGATSNMFTYLSKGDTSLSISLTAVVSVITPFTIPILAALSMSYFMGNSTEFNLPIAKTIIQLLVITVVPVALGMFVLSRWPNMASKVEHYLRWFSILFLLLIIMLIVLKNKDNILDFFAQAGLATLLLNVLVLILGYQLAKIAKLPQPQAVSIGFEVGIQNGTLALLVAGTLIGNEVMMVPAVTYSLFMFLSGAIFGWWINKKATNV
ncbi:bile acid:sodium symporter family protein [Thiomicrorhabdus sp. Kp2]|uniref:bile acid:sodium symporter family protein n=1 Tax=Thiomicrorhabdus sp. Kp2 TaxID=1123518 RepID=UPI000427E736|nr:bile acid:sodium symporter family protein [Thiomicrorhabdus sp. Kp2]